MLPSLIYVIMTLTLTDRQHCFKSGNICKNKGGQISSHLIFVSSLMIDIKFDRHQKGASLSKSILQGACPCLPQPQF